ncbi:MAG: glutamate--tRNA ligase [Candidatus Gottesmanbacteria bacterium]|nr:glutamate--tRNA ligase [Candidatus Gottesmanbacteria bacterium]
MSAVRTRIAPSPTGQDLHIGNAYTALINYVFARAHNGQFIIRVEDTDRTRLVTGAEDRILASLRWLGIPYAEGPDIGGPFAPYRQSERLDIYKKHAEELVAKNHAYYCFCTPQRLDQMRKDLEAKHLPPMYDGLCKKIDSKKSKKRVAAGEKYVIRMNVPDEGTTIFHDVIRGDISFANILIDDQVILKSDGFPTYHLGVVVDDHIMKITHIIRGEEWISSTPKHILLYKFFGWDVPLIAHVSVLRNPDRTKLSKRKNPVWVSEYKAKGFLPDAIKNYLATMAWSYPGGQDIFSVDEMISKFRLEDIQTTAPIFDTEKLRWMNGEYIRHMKSEKLKNIIYEFYNKKYPEKQIETVLPLLVERMKTLAEFETLAGFFFVRPPKHAVRSELRTALESSEWNHDAMEKTIRDVAGANAKEIFMELRVAVTGKTVGPPLLESLEILGKEETLTRIPSSAGR